MGQNSSSYISAGVFPVKLLKNKIIEDGKVMPVHIQLYPTNVCNLNCSFCSCANRNRKDTLSFDVIKEVLDQAARCGCKAVTISGGGEPTLHPNINDIIEYITSDVNMVVGMATNGMSLEKVNPETLNKMTWVRISHDDNRDFGIDYQNKISKIVKEAPDVDWGFSYVVTSNARYVTIKNIIEFANIHKFTHVRLVSDLLNLDSVEEMGVIKTMLHASDVDDSKVVYQGRKKYTYGRSKCLISLLKPVINADGTIQPCCGSQYAKSVPSRKCDDDMSMGHVTDLEKIYKEQKYFDGSVCDRCYYDDYNTTLEQIVEDIDHVEFV